MLVNWPVSAREERDMGLVMRAAGIDYGKVRVGIAISDELGALAHPRPFLDARDLRSLLGALAALCTAESVSVLVLGLPRQLDGGEGLAARRVRKFAAQLRQHLGLRVELVDEWLSTREAHGRLQAGGHNARSARERVDSAAAAILLQSWLDRRRGQS
jgi:putative Holliday junction resolvase